MPEIHPTAIVDRRAELADDVVIGPYCIIKSGVKLGPGTIVHEHSHIHGNTVTGRNCVFGPAAYIGLAPQHLKHDGAGSWLIMGDNVIFRETASAHRSIKPGIENATRIGDRGMFMVACHVGHDSVVGNDVVLANAALLGGHVRLDDKAFIGGGATVHQFVHVGRLTIVAGNAAFTHDVPPFAAVRYDGLKGYNAIGCKRSGMPRESIFAIRSAYRCIHTNRVLSHAVAEIRSKVAQVPEVLELLDFIAKSKRGILPSVRYLRGSRRPIAMEVDDDN